jgi:hypothetical protein
MSYESVLNLKEYLHLTFQVLLFLALAFFVNLDVDVFVAYSFVCIGVVSFAYFLQLNFDGAADLSSWKFKKEEGDTEYNIVAPFGSALIIFWVAFVDFNSQSIISKFTGILLMCSAIFSLQAIDEVKRRIKERFVSDTSEVIHTMTIWAFNSAVWFIALKYFIVTGTWEWDIPNPIDMLNTILGMDDLG